MAKLMSKSGLIQTIADEHPNNLTRKDVKGVFDLLTQIGHKELKKTGAFVMPGFSRNLLSSRNPPQRRGKASIPFTKEPTVFKAKPARKMIKARPVKAAKDAVS